MVDTIAMGLDAGMGAIKVWSQNGGLDVLSQVATNGSGHLDAMIGLKSAKRPLYIETKDGHFYVGRGSHDYGRPVENLDFDRLIGSPEMRAMVYGTWTRYMQAHGIFKAPLSVMVGLPLQTMGENMKEYRKAMRDWLSGSHTWIADGAKYGLTVERVRTNSQPVGALFDYILNDGLKLVEDHKGALTSEVGVLSVGFNTLEFMVVQNQTAKEKFTGGEKLGVRRLLELLNYDRAYSLGELDVMLRSGGLKYKEKLPTWASEVNGAIENIWGDSLSRFAAVLVVGGGAILLGNHLKLRGKGVVAADPVMSISHGLYKLDKTKK